MLRLSYRDAGELTKSMVLSVQLNEIAQFLFHLPPHNIPIGRHRLVHMKQDRVKMGLLMLSHPDQTKDLLLELPLRLVLLSIRPNDV